MKIKNRYIFVIVLTLVILGPGRADAQQALAQEADAIFQQNCLNCHGASGSFDPETQAGLLEKLTQLQTETSSTVPFVHVDWFLATASLPPLYHDILGLPQTDRLLEAQLEVNVASNIRNAPGIDVWRAGFNDSGVSKNNRVVERHTSRYGAYWKSYDFAGSAGSQNIFTHPLDFT